MKKIKILAVLFLLLTTLFTACSKSFEKLSSVELIEIGEKYLIEMEYEQAIVYFSRVVEIEPRNPRGYTGLAEAYVGLSDPDKAFEHLKSGMLELPNDSSITEMFDNLIQDQFEIGEQLLNQQDYQKAIEHFAKLALLVPSMEQVYIKGAEAYIGLGDMDKAIEFLKKGLEHLPNNSTLTEMLEELEYEKEREDLTSVATPILEELTVLCSSDNYDSVFDKMQTEEFAKVTALSNSLNRPYIVDTEHGRIGVYEVNSKRYGNYMIYFGDYNGDIREGSGVWLGHYEGQNYFAKGIWANDKPNGEMQIREWHSNLDASVMYRVITGNVVDGLWNGDVTWAFEENSGFTSIFPVQFDMGRWVVIEISNHENETRYEVSHSGITKNENHTGTMSVKTLIKVKELLDIQMKFLKISIKILHLI